MSAFWLWVILAWSLATLVLPLVTALVAAVAFDFAVFSSAWSWDRRDCSCWRLNASAGQTEVVVEVVCPPPLPAVHPSRYCFCWAAVTRAWSASTTAWAWFCWFWALMAACSSAASWFWSIDSWFVSVARVAAAWLTDVCRVTVLWLALTWAL